MPENDSIKIAKNALDNYSLNLNIMTYMKTGKVYAPEDVAKALNELKIVGMTRCFYELSDDYDALNIIDKMYAAALSVTEYSTMERTSRISTYRKIGKIIELAAKLCEIYDYTKFSKEVFDRAFVKRKNTEVSL